MKKFAVILAGCGVFDGAEVHEATLTLLSIEKHGAEYQCFAPDVSQYHVINHITGEEMPETRNVLIESARIARGNILELSEYDPSEYDALIFPGGFGVAKNLCDFAVAGPDCTINDKVEKAIVETSATGKPIGALCISPVMIAKLFEGVEVTIGQDPGTAEAVSNMGAIHVITDHGEVIVDSKRNIFTTPCYMLDANILQIWEGVDNIVKAMLKVM